LIFFTTAASHESTVARHVLFAHLARCSLNLATCSAIAASTSAAASSTTGGAEDAIAGRAIVAAASVATIFAGTEDADAAEDSWSEDDDDDAARATTNLTRLELAHLFFAAFARAPRRSAAEESDVVAADASAAMVRDVSVRRTAVARVRVLGGRSAAARAGGDIGTIR
jgi:hypothetical protein